MFFARVYKIVVLSLRNGGKRRWKRRDATGVFERRAKDGRPRGRVARAENCFLNANRGRSFPLAQTRDVGTRFARNVIVDTSGLCF